MIIPIGRGHVELNSENVRGFHFVNQLETRSIRRIVAFKDNFAWRERHGVMNHMAFTVEILGAKTALPSLRINDHQIIVRRAFRLSGLGWVFGMISADKNFFV